ncbi:glycoside hydrolase family 113 [Calidifontibacillus erzurumensis]|uniref:Uncharacterized protein n=1 Tax=Calidifontibacillus erzurumensis TaxID=2741433 RepID=A0A8J8K8W2_9BACI|nr:hypothetical protein [Calidifontibacillus erzurumensis]NSL52401.1 hypothetical protein [Calidifontibacillus erzurumensis]
MLKSELMICVILAVLLLLIFFLGKAFSSIKREDQIKTSDMETPVVIKNLPNFPRNIEENKKRSPFRYSSDEFQAGMNVIIYGHPDTLESRNVFEHLRSLGINSVAINFPFYQSDWKANEVITSPIYTPTIEELQAVIEEAHHIGLSVMIRPIMDEQAFLPSNMWRGQIKPKDPNAWFDSYEKLILTYAMLAQSTNAKSLNIGTELNSMQNQYQNRWMKLIEKVRQVYKGELVYSFNFDTVHEIHSIEFVKLLDYIGIDAYFPLELPDYATTEMLEKEWMRQIKQMKETLWQKPILVTEAGIIPVAGAYRTPYSGSLPNQRYDPQAQVNYYEATYNVWKPRVQGIYWWGVLVGQDPNEISFSPLNMPTEKVIKKQFLKGFSNE